jgi:uncharacterized peroxidase-related enzyme
MTMIASLPEDSTLSNVFKLFPRTSVPLMQYCEVVMRGQSPLTTAEREPIAAYVSGLNRCNYCHGVHAQIALEFGVGEELLSALMDDLEAAPVDARLKPILRYTEKLTKTPSRMVQSDADAVLEAGWDEQALHDAVSVCALFNLFNRLVEGLGLPGGEETVKPRGKMLAEIGYAGATASISTR